MPEKKTNTAEPGKEQALLERIAALESKLELLKFAEEDIQRKRDSEPLEMWTRAKERVEKSREPQSGKFTWKVFVPGLAHVVTFNSDTENEAAAIREFETRYGTKFISNSQRSDGNHAIERVAT